MRAWLRGVMGAGGAAPRPPRRHHGATSSGEGATTLQRFYAMDCLRLSERLHSVYEPLAQDAETSAFLASCQPSLLLSLAAKLLRMCYSVTDTNGILGRGQMFVMSRAHYRELLGSALASAAVVSEEGGASALGGSERGAPLPAASQLTLLDVGAGDGDVTARLAPLFGHVSVTEVSRPMARRLAQRGYDTHVTPFLTEDSFPEPGVFDVVSVHNVLDRCDHPRELLRGAIRLLRPVTGRLLLAVVLPLCEFVEDGTKRRPVNGPLPMAGARCADGASFEASLNALVERVLEPLGLVVERVSKVPYLCRGDMWKPYYVLSDAVLVCRVAADVGDAPHESVVDASPRAAGRKQALQPSGGGFQHLVDTSVEEISPFLSGVGRGGVGSSAS